MQLQPRLPPGVTRLTVRRLCYQGAWLRLSYNASSATVLLQDGASAVCGSRSVKPDAGAAAAQKLCLQPGSGQPWQPLTAGKAVTFASHAGAQVAAGKQCLELLRDAI